jgi:hypothetical protein
MKLVEEALGQVTKARLEQIHEGVEVSAHIEAAERDLRNALRQLVMAKRTRPSSHGLRAAAASDGCCWEPSFVAARV